jgi:hypothetical protein
MIYDSSNLQYSLITVLRGPVIISRSSDKGRGRDEMITGVLPFCAGRILKIVRGYDTPIVDISIIFDFFPVWLSRTRSRRILPGISLWLSRILLLLI